MLAGFKRPKNSAVFISGSGSTLQALLENQHQFPIKIIITNKKNTLGEIKAKRFGIRSYFFSKNENYHDLNLLLIKEKIDTLFLAGFLKVLPADFVQIWENKIYNIHPSLLPEFPGLHSAEKSFQEKKQMGVTIHQVNAEIDRGKIFLQMHSLLKDVSKNIELSQAMLFLRRSEQHLLREFSTRVCL